MNEELFTVSISVPLPCGHVLRQSHRAKGPIAAKDYERVARRATDILVNWVQGRALDHTCDPPRKGKSG